MGAVPARAAKGGMYRMLRKIITIIVGLILGIIVGGILAFVTGGLLVNAEIGAMQTTVNGWTHTLKCGAIDNGILVKAACARVLPAANLPAEAVYWTAKVDGAGNTLNGQHNYILHFPPGGTPPNDAFWSLTMMNAKSLLLVANPIKWDTMGHNGHKKGVPCRYGPALGRRGLSIQFLGAECLKNQVMVA
jgi:hypothetical protein